MCQDWKRNSNPGDSGASQKPGNDHGQKSTFFLPWCSKRGERSYHFTQPVTWPESHPGQTESLWGKAEPEWLGRYTERCFNMQNPKWREIPVRTLVKSIQQIFSEHLLCAEIDLSWTCSYICVSWIEVNSLKTSLTGMTRLVPHGLSFSERRIWDCSHDVAEVQKMRGAPQVLFKPLLAANL